MMLKFVAPVVAPLDIPRIMKGVAQQIDALPSSRFVKVTPPDNINLYNFQYQGHLHGAAQPVAETPPSRLTKSPAAAPVVDIPKIIRGVPIADGQQTLVSQFIGGAVIPVVPPNRHFICAPSA